MPDLPVAAPDHAAAIRERVEAREAGGWHRYDAEARADVRWLLVERQQDKERIERLTEALKEIADADVFDVYPEDGEDSFAAVDENVRRVASAALAVEEDAE